MRRFKTYGDWRKFVKGAVQAGRHRLIFRSEGHAKVFAVSETQKIPIAVLVEGDAEISVSLHEDCEIVCEGAEVWYKPPALDQTAFKTSDVSFASLDRPAPLSPEMAAIERMMRRNALDRERDLARMERLINANKRTHTERSDSGAVLENTETEEPDVLVEKPIRKQGDTEEPASDGKSDAVSELDVSPGRRKASGSSRKKGDAGLRVSSDTDSG